MIHYIYTLCTQILDDKHTQVNIHMRISMYPKGIYTHLKGICECTARKHYGQRDCDSYGQRDCDSTLTPKCGEAVVINVTGVSPAIRPVSHVNV